MRAFLAIALLLVLALAGLVLWSNWDTSSPGIDTSGLTREAVPGHVAALSATDASRTCGSGSRAAASRAGVASRA